MRLPRHRRQRLRPQDREQRHASAAGYGKPSASGFRRALASGAPTSEAPSEIRIFRRRRQAAFPRPPSVAFLDHRGVALRTDLRNFCGHAISNLVHVRNIEAAKTQGVGSTDLAGSIFNVLRNADAATHQKSYRGEYDPAEKAYSHCGHTLKRGRRLKLHCWQTATFPPSG
jgi:hypothetical protein